MYPYRRVISLNGTDITLPKLGKRHLGIKLKLHEARGASELF